MKLLLRSVGLVDRAGGHYSVMSENVMSDNVMGENGDDPSIELDEPPNLRPGPTEQGGHGGMATREQEARIYAEQAEDAESSD